MHTVEPTQRQLDSARRRLYAYIFPNNPVTDSEKAVFEEAVVLQAEHDASIEDSGLPQGAKSFSIGHFSMTMDSDAQSERLNRRTICAEAYGILLREGLLYKGVERDWL